TARKYLERIGPEKLALLDNGSPVVSMITDPTGKPVSDIMQADEGLCTAEIDLAKALPVKRIHDVVGYYNRFDIFSLKVNKAKNLPIDICNAGNEQAFPKQDAPAGEHPDSA